MSTAFEVAAWLGELGAAAELEVEHAVTYHGQLLQTAVKRHATGRPGPNMPTGDYNRSIGLIINRTDHGYQALVGTDKPQGRRLELGFDAGEGTNPTPDGTVPGVDSLGRVFHQKPLPHFGPALDEIKPGFEAAIEAAGTPIP